MFIADRDTEKFLAKSHPSMMTPLGAHRERAATAARPRHAGRRAMAPAGTRIPRAPGAMRRGAAAPGRAPGALVRVRRAWPRTVRLDPRPAAGAGQGDHRGGRGRLRRMVGTMTPGGALDFTPALSDYGDPALEGKLFKKFGKFIKKAGRYVGAAAVLAPAAIIGGKKGAKLIGKISGSKRFEKFTAKAITPLRIVAAVVGAAVFAPAIIAKGASLAKMAAGKFGGLLSKITGARKAAGLPPISAESLATAIEDQRAAPDAAGLSDEELAARASEALTGRMDQNPAAAEAEARRLAEELVTPAVAQAEARRIGVAPVPAAGGSGTMTYETPEPATGGMVAQDERVTQEVVSGPVRPWYKRPVVIGGGLAAVAVVAYLLMRRRGARA